METPLNNHRHGVVASRPHTPLALNTVIRFAAASLALVVVGIATTATARADRHPVYTAADAYRDAVLDFERQVFRARGVDRIARTLADELEDQTSRVKRAARDLDDFNELIVEYNQALRLHQQIEAIIFADPRSPFGLTLQPLWQRVLVAADVVGGHITAIQNGGIVGPLGPTQLGDPRLGGPLFPPATGGVYGSSRLNPGLATRPLYGNVYGGGIGGGFYGSTVPGPAVGVQIQSHEYRLPGGAIYSRPPVIVPAVPDCPQYGRRNIGGISIGANLQRF